MAISKNITMDPIGAGRAAAEDAPPPPKPPARGGALGPLKGLMGINPLTIQTVTDAAQTETKSGADSLITPGPGKGAFNIGAVQDIRDIRDIQIFDGPPLVFQVNKTTTQIAQGAMNQLRGAAPGVIREAVSTIKNKNIAAAQLLNHLERKTRVGEVLNELANDWSAETKQDFAEAFQMTNSADKLPVMDAMVSIAILNDPDLKNELLAENTSDASQADLLENRRIVWQWPQPGTPFTPPYLIMVAVERQDTTQAQNIVQSIIGDLVDFQGYKVPTAAANKLK